MILLESNLSPEQQASDATKQLIALYDNYYSYLLGFLRDKALFSRKVSFPLLIKPFPAYFASDVKLMIVGQETYGWSISDKNVPFITDGKNDERIHSLMMLYKNVRSEKARKSPFWRFTRELNRRFNSSNEAFIWNNISKVDENRTVPKWDVFRGTSATSSHPVINREFEILKPNVVVFTTGVRRDNCLRSVFKGVKEEPVNEFISKLSHKLLPYHSYRTEHPRTLSINGQFNKVVEFVSNEVKSKGLMVDYKSTGV